METYDFTGANGDPLPSGLVPVGDSAWAIQGNALQKTGNATSGLNVVAETKSGNNFELSVDLRLGTGSPVKSGIAYRITDDYNFSAISLSNGGNLIFEEYVSGSRDQSKDVIILQVPNFSVSNYYNLTVKYIRSFMVIELDGESVFQGYRVINGSNLIGLWTLTGDGVLFDNLAIDYPSNSDLAPNKIHSGISRVVTKLGQLFGVHSQVPAGSSEYWPTVYPTANFDQWPSSQYPLVMYSSTDHDSTFGGIYLRVYESALGSIDNPAAWHEWQDISGRAEFNHITEKGNPILVTTNIGQVETPTLLDINGALRLYFHQMIGTYNQSTWSATGTNGVDFTSPVISFPYNPQNYEGDGHNGYFDFGPNPFTEIPYNYIGVALHGGGNYPNGPQIQSRVSNDGESWEFLKLIGKPTGFNTELFTQDGMQLILSNLGRAVPEGDYYRAIARNKVVGSGGAVSYDEVGEVLVDSELRIVSEYKSLLTPDSGSWDNTSIRNAFEFDYDGSTYIVYINKASTTDSKIGIASVTTEPRDWNVRRIFDNEATTSYASQAGQVASGLTYNGTATASALDSYSMTTLTVPLSGAEVSAESSDAIIPSNYDYVDLFFDLIGKDSDSPIEIEMGLTDSVSSPTTKAVIQWPYNSSDTSLPMVIAAVSPGFSDAFDSNNYIITNNNSSSNLYSTGKQRIGLRLIPSEKRIAMLEGAAETDSFVFDGYDFDAPVKPFIKANFSEAQAEDSSISFSSISSRTYMDEIPNQPPVATAGPDQSVAAGVRVQLNASMSSDPEDGTISQFGWEQVDNGADAVVLEFANTATPEFTAPSSLTAQTLEFRVQAQDSEGATSTDTVLVNVAALEENAILSTMETLDFELVTQGNLIAFKGRSNREVMRLKPSSDVGIATEDGYLDLSKNGIAKIEIIANGKKISNSNSDSIKIDGNRILARLGDLDIPTSGRDSITPTFMVVLYVGSDTRGLVVASNATAGYKPLSYRVEEAS